MCGIIYHSGKNANTKVLHQYKEQKARGSEGFGFVTIQKDTRKIKVYRAQTEKNILDNKN